MENLLRPIKNLAHQADATRRDKAFEQDVKLDPVRICILRRPQEQSPITAVIEERSKLTTVNLDPQPSPILEEPRRPQWTPKGIERHTERLDRKDSLRTMEKELQLTETPKTQPQTTQKPTAKDLKDLLQVDICGISAVGFYRNLI